MCLFEPPIKLKKRLDQEKKITEVKEGVVLEALPDTMFRVKVSDAIVLAYLSGKMRMNRIKVLIGDKVQLELDQYGERGRITRRL